LYLAQPMWFKGLRMLESHPELATVDFSWRVMVAAEDCQDRAKASVLSQTARLIERVVASGVDVAAKEKLGESAVTATTRRRTGAISRKRSNAFTKLCCTTTIPRATTTATRCRASRPRCRT
jgi:hypothetical protein